MTARDEGDTCEFEDLYLNKGFNDYGPAMYILATNEPTGGSSFLVDTGTTSLFTGDKTTVDSPLEISPIKVNVGKNDAHFLATQGYRDPRTGKRTIHEENFQNTLFEGQCGECFILVDIHVQKGDN